MSVKSEDDSDEDEEGEVQLDDNAARVGGLDTV